MSAVYKPSYSHLKLCNFLANVSMSPFQSAQNNTTIDHNYFVVQSP
jgi:hypothetical protein